MSALPFSTSDHPPHGHPQNTQSSTQSTDKPSTASHPPPTKPDPTTTLQGTPSNNSNAAQGGLPAANPSTSAKLSSLQVKLRSALRQYPDFPSPGILFEDVMPIFADATLHANLIDALELHILTALGPTQKPDVIVGPEARGFLFGPSLALRLGAAFVPVRKRGKLPGPTETVSYKKEYGEDLFQVQRDSIKEGQKVIVVDDLIATGEYTTSEWIFIVRSGRILIDR